MILDGWGIPSPGMEGRSAIAAAQTPFVTSLYGQYPHSHLEASGGYVGLPDGQMGNSEVGHTNLGAGRVVMQNLVRLNKVVRENRFGQEPLLAEAFSYVKASGKAMHYIGLVSDGGVHAHIDHLKSLCTAAHEAGVTRLFVHAFTDGRDTDPKSGLGFIESLQQHLAQTTGQLATVIGRYYAMDRDNRWERIKLAYDALVRGIGTPVSPEGVGAAIQASYDQDVTDEFIKPLVVTENGRAVGCIEDGDAVLCFNFRTDRGREITEALTQREFPEQGMKPLNLRYLTMTSYDKAFTNVGVLFDEADLKKTLGEVIAAAGKKQIRIAETEKYPHVTFFFSGGREEPFPGESRILCPSPKVATYDLQPEMSARDIRDGIIPELEKQEADFVCLNFANTDMVGHTGVFEAVVRAAETVDACTQAVVTTGLQHGYTFLIIADHGNAEYMLNDDGTPNTAHTTSLVPCILADSDYRPQLHDGKLADIAPTILQLMGLPQPPEMDGTSLIDAPQVG